MFGRSHDRLFEKLFRDHIDNAAACADDLVALFAQFGRESDAPFQQIIDREHRSDKLLAEVHDLVDRSFITRFDKSDIVALVDRIDNILDGIKTVARRSKMFRLKSVRPEAQQFADLIRQGTAALQPAIGQIGTINGETARATFLKANELEEAGDDLLDSALVRLFSDSSDSSDVLIWKDIFEGLEKITDHCQTVAVELVTISRKEAR